MSINTTLEAMKAKRDEAGEDGFTLIELLVVVVIIGILVAIAIPLYLNYRKGAENKSAESDVRGAISAVEQYYTSNGNAYPSASQKFSATGNLTAGTGGSPQQISVGSNNEVQYVAASGSYKLCGWSKNGKHAFYYDSSQGGSVADKGEVTALSATCDFTPAA